MSIRVLKDCGLGRVADSHLVCRAAVDGNKRTAFYVTVDFLEQNGFQRQTAKGVEHAKLMEQLSQGKITRDKAAAHLREHSIAVP